MNGIVHVYGLLPKHMLSFINQIARKCAFLSLQSRVIEFLQFNWVSELIMYCCNYCIEYFLHVYPHLCINLQCRAHSSICSENKILTYKLIEQKQ